MKKSIYTIIITLVFNYGYIIAQTEATEETSTFTTLFDRVDSVSGFGSFFLNFGSNNNDAYVLSGGSGAVSLNESYYLGGFGLGGPISAKTKNDVSLLFNIGYGGFLFGYIYNKDRLIHPTGSLKLGWGNIKAENGSATDNIFAIVPQIGAELNIAEWVKIELGLNYQLITGINLLNIEPSQFRKLQIGLDFKFGWFQ